MNSQECGVITRLSGPDMAYVRIDDMEIPVYCTDITGSTPQQVQKAHKSESSAPQPVTNNAMDNRQSKSMGTGVCLSFLPVKRRDGDIDHFRIYLVNDTPQKLAFRYRFFVGNAVHFSMDKEVGPAQVFLLHEITFDLLNESPEFDLLLTDIADAGWKASLVQKIKPQNFFNKSGVMPLSGEEAFVYRIPEVSKPVRVPATKPKVAEKLDLSLLKQMMLDSTVSKDHEWSGAAREVDLHIEKLTPHPASMDNTEMLFLQLARFQQSLDRAIAGGLDRFYVIHGNGSGKLKKEIHRLLKHCKEVKSFNNNYHPRYSFGATEIILH